ncbi:MAG: maltose alpha-D-glucosyltransferase [Actinomycetia bacterium]|nr:maltose alpha-D-glucosyltransferase [Actinomycetes bacterium]
MSDDSEPWYRTAVFYEVAVHSYADSNGDGIGDLQGLTERLAYLEWLGITAIWILPIFPSPMRDGGYDVSDYLGIRPEFGDFDDFRTLIEQAHRRGIRVITDFIVNHTSNQHPWFQEARLPGSRKRDWYVWTDDPSTYSEARVIFVDTHTSNWAWDEVAGQYYWHRFFDHQPDLNYDNPAVRDAIADAMRFWLDMGLDGLRLDAVPYLFEREGTNCENLPETHAYLKEIRSMIDDEYPGVVLLAEANQRPEDLLAYFGDGDECHMAFNFPIMPLLFLAVASDDATVVAKELAATPDIPRGCQWSVFLRNHDELTLEMVTSTQRAALYDAYAPDPAMRKNVGIRRRLAPLLNGDRRKIELLHAVLLSLPGSPVMYYGDEIGMGDDIVLPDRDGVRTPMQWNPTPSAGWSDADPTHFYLPVVSDDAYGPNRVNVHDERADEHSLLSAVRNLIAMRPPAFGTAAFKVLNPGDPRVLAIARGEFTVAANFSSAPLTVRCGTDSYVAGNGTIKGNSVSLPPYGWLWMGPA